MVNRRSTIQTFEERLIAFDHALPSADASVRALLADIRDAVLRTKSELEQIHISALPFTSGIQPICFDCGEKNLDVVYTSRRDRCQLCAPCFYRREKRGAARTDGRLPQPTAVSAANPKGWL